MHNRDNTKNESPIADGRIKNLIKARLSNSTLA